VVSLQSPTGVSNIIDTTNKDIFETINIIKNAKLFIGISSGPSWLAWALHVPTVLISGYSAEWAEMQDCARILNKDVCNSCWQDVSLPIDRGNWNWCPRGKDFECSKKITPEMVIKGINKYL
jgi:autotransporter strand-loop-strand O-heptosyltransferase